jgi:recombination protein RecA
MNTQTTMDEKQRNKAIDAAIAAIEKQFGKGSIMKMNDDAVTAIPVISSGSLGLDLALGVGGFARGRIVEIYGPEASGKTTLTLHAIAECQKAGGVAAFIDAEHALDTVYAANLGVKVEDLLVAQPDSGEQALEIVETLVRSNALDMIIVDSVAALIPRQELDGDMGDLAPGAQARLMSKALRKLVAVINKSNTTLIFINQLRMKIGVMFGSPETTTGGNALKFYCSQRLDIRRVSSIKKGEDVLGSRTRVKVVKNKLAPPFRKVEFDIMYGEGISQEGEALDLGLEVGVVKRSGAWYSFGETRLGQGRDNSKDFLVSNPDVFAEIQRLVRVHNGLEQASEGDIINEEAPEEKETSKKK